MEEKVLKRDEIPKKLCVSCPICSTLLIRAERIKNTVIKCGKCHNLILIEIENGRVAVDTKLPDKE